MTTTKPAAPTGTLTLGPVRVAYPYLLKPRESEYQGQKKTQFEAVLLIPKDAPDMIEKLRAAIRASFAAKFGTEVKLSKDKSPIRDGDESTDEEGTSPGKYPGYWFANVTQYSDNPPILKHADKSPITDPGALSSGDWVYMSINPRAYSFENTKGVSLKVLGARLVRKGEPIGKSVDMTEVADALDDIDIPVETADDEAF